MKANALGFVRGPKQAITAEANLVYNHLRELYGSNKEIVADADFQLAVASELHLEPVRRKEGSLGEQRLQRVVDAAGNALEPAIERLRAATRRAITILLVNGYIYPTACGFQFGRPRGWAELPVDLVA